MFRLYLLLVLVAVVVGVRESRAELVAAEEKDELLLVEQESLVTEKVKSDKVLEQGISALRFDSRKKTTTRGGFGRPQLECVGGSARGYWWNYPKVVECTNQGFDGSAVTWKCDATLKSNLHFGALNVECEGYDSPDDEYVLVGSCGLEYTLYFTEFTISWVHVTSISLLVFSMITGYMFTRHFASMLVPKRSMYHPIQ